MQRSPLAPWLYFFETFFVFVLFSKITHQDEIHPDNTKTEADFSRAKRLMLKTPDRLWTHGIVPFTFNTNMDSAAIREVKVAMSVYQYYTPIRFLPKNDTLPGLLGHGASADFIKERRYSCHSREGRQEQPGQEISCCKRGTCIHEIGHLLGFAHEISHPDRDQWVRMNWNSIPHRGMHSPFLKEGDRSTFYVPPYDLSSFMHYIPWNYRSGPRFDILFSELTVNKRIFYMFKELCHVYRCYDFPQCQGQNLKCHNEGYVSVVDGRCACICLPAFDPETGCSKLKTVSSVTEFPQGSYSIPKHGDSDCPNGMTSHDVDGVEGLSVCERDPGDINEEVSEWPRGTYCFLAVNSSCPTKTGFVAKRYSLIQRTSDNDTKSLTFCCIETDIPRNPVSFQVASPFSLIMYYERSCQQFVGMRVEERAIAFEANKTTLATDGPFTTEDGHIRHIYTCDYTPVDMNCGGIIELNDTLPSTQIETNWIDSSNKDCTWVIKGPPEKGALVLNFGQFSDLRKDGDDCVDAVEVNHVRLGQAGIRYCGEPMRHSIRSVYNNMTVRFQTSGDSKAKFEATIVWKPAKDWCYNAEDAGRSYAGNVNYTRYFQACLPWMDALKCNHNPYSKSDKFHVLEGNACRNPDNSLRPWCYTEVGLNHPGTPYINCKREFCDVCQLEAPFDKWDNCTVMKMQGICSNAKSLALEKCAKTCANDVTEAVKTKASVIQCPSPGDIANSELIDGQQSYHVGDTISYRCKRNINFTIQRICLTTGEWSVANTACTECPVGFSYEHGSCYGYVDKWVTFQDAIDECKKIGASLTSVRSGWENDLIFGLMPEGIPSIWLGGNLGVKNNEVVTAWEDGTPATFTGTWSTAIYVPRKGIPLVMSFYNGQWDVKPADTKMPFVCKMDSDDEADCMDVYDNCDQLVRNSTIDTCNVQKIRNFCRLSCRLC